MTAEPANEERLAQTLSVMQLLDSWKVEPAQCVKLLGLPGNTKPRALKRYRENTPLPAEADVTQRMQCFFDIHKALLTTFPFNAHMGGVWMHTPNRWFNNATPLSIMVHEGLAGIYKVRGHLDCTYNWV